MAEQLLWVDIVIAHVLLHGNVEWPTTWVHGEQSAPGLFSTREAARAAAEAQRSPSSVFYIREVPAICLRTESSIHLVADYRQPRPFSGMSVSRFSRLLKTGTSLEQLFAALSPMSGCWVEPPPKHSLLRIQLDSDAELTSAKSRRLTNWWSMVCVHEQLAWTAEESTIDRTRLNAIRLAFLRVNSTPPEPDTSVRILPSARPDNAQRGPMLSASVAASRKRAVQTDTTSRHWEDDLVDGLARMLRSMKEYFGFVA